MTLVRNLLLIIAGIALYPNPVGGACLFFGVVGIATLKPGD